MGLGLSKDFVIFLFLSLALAYGSGNWKNGVTMMSVYIICKIIWKILTE